MKPIEIVTAAQIINAKIRNRVQVCPNYRCWELYIYRRFSPSIAEPFHNIVKRYKQYLKLTKAVSDAVSFKYVSPPNPNNLILREASVLEFVLKATSFKYDHVGIPGLNGGNPFNVGYSYDYSTARLNTVSRKLIK